MYCSSVGWLFIQKYDIRPKIKYCLFLQSRPTRKNRCESNYFIVKIEQVLFFIGDCPACKSRSKTIISVSTYPHLDGEGHDWGNNILILAESYVSSSFTWHIQNTSVNYCNVENMIYLRKYYILRIKSSTSQFFIRYI